MLAADERDGPVSSGRLGGRARTVARAVPGAVAAQGAAALGALLPQGPDPAGRTEERRADGGAGGPGRYPAAAPLRLDLALGDRAARGRAGQGRRPARRRPRRGLGRGRHRAREAGPALGRGEAPVLRPARQEGQLPVAGLAHARPGRGAGRRRAAAVPAGGLERRRRPAGVPETVAYRPKWKIALDEIDRVLAVGARFGSVLADAEYGKAAEFRHGLAERRLAYAVGILPAQKVYPVDVTLAFPARRPAGRPRKHPVPSAASAGAAERLEARPAAFRAVSWRTGTKGPLEAEFAALRVRVADGPAVAGGRHLPGDEAWLVGERRASGERKYYLSNLPPDATLETLAALIKGRWVCEQLHQQLKDELGLDHFEGRGWRGLHHHALLCLLAFAFLQHLRVGGEKPRGGDRARPAAPAEPARRAPRDRGRTDPRAPLLPALSAALRAPPPAMKVAA